MPHKEESKVNTPGVFYNDRKEDWQIVEDLMGGTRQMRENALVHGYLTEQKGEEFSNQRDRINVGVLYEAFADTVDKLSSKPYIRPIQLPDVDLTDIIDINDVDGRQTTFADLSQDILRDQCTYGIGYVLVDAPNVPEGLNLGQERALNVRPLYVRISPTNLIGKTYIEWRGRQYVSQIRIKESVVESDGQWGERSVEQVRVINGQFGNEGDDDYRPGSYEIHRKVDDDYVVVESGNFGFKYGVPLVEIEADSTQRPPLMGLANLNIQHFVHSSLQDYNLAVVRYTTWHLAGFKDHERPKSLGMRQMFMSANGDSKVSTVEFKCDGFKTAADHIAKIEDRMEVMGMQPLIRKSSTATATSTAINDNRSNAPLQLFVGNNERGMTQCIRFGSAWTKRELPNDFAVGLYKDFAISQQRGERAELFLKARINGDITRLDFWDQVKKLGMIDESTDPGLLAGNADREERQLDGTGFDLTEQDNEANNSDGSDA